jgi:hypothetical protein
MNRLDFRQYCESACIKLWGEPDKRTKKELRWNGGDAYSTRTYTISKRAWYDHGAKRGGSTLDLVDYHKGRPKRDLRGSVFFDVWREANEIGIVPEPAPEPKTNGKGPPILATYPYHDEEGALLFEVVRFDTPDPKGRFRQRRPDGRGGWIWNVKGVHQVLYRLPELLEALACDKPVLICEGERDCNTAVKLGYVATTMPGGVDKWRAEYDQSLSGASDLVIVSDNDQQSKDPKTGELQSHPDGRPVFKGQDHAAKLANRLSKVATRLRTIMFEVKDLTEWVAAGGTREQLDALIEQAPDYASQEPPHSVNDGAAFGYSWHLIWHGAVDPTSARKWLVQDLLPETGVTLISGQWGTFKTFVADDLSAAVMTATTFANKQVMRKGGVLFLACEGQNEVDIRLTAAFRKHGGKGNAPFAWVQGCPRLFDPNAGKILAAMVKHAAAKMMEDFGLPVAMVIIDTTGKAAGLSKSGELNDDAVAKVIMNALAEASAQTGALFVGVAHFGKNVETGTKGSTGFEDDADVVLALLGERGINGIVNNPVLCARKCRSGPNGEEFPFQTEEADIGPNEKGIIEKTLTIRWADAADVKAAARSKKKDDPWAVKSLRHLRQTMMNMLADCGSEQRPYPDGPIVRAVDIEVVRAEFYKSYPATGDEAAKKEARRKAFNRAIDVAHDKHLTRSRDIGATTFIWLTNPTQGAGQ